MSSSPSAQKGIDGEIIELKELGIRPTKQDFGFAMCTVRPIVVEPAIGS